MQTDELIAHIGELSEEVRQMSPEERTATYESLLLAGLDELMAEFARQSFLYNKDKVAKFYGHQNHQMGSGY